MGFYIDLQEVDPTVPRFQEVGTPPVFWVLFFIGGFALACMGLAAHSLLGQLLSSGSVFDIAIVGVIGSFVLAYFVIGIKFLGLRKFVEMNPESLEVGFNFFGRRVWVTTISKNTVKEVLLRNQRPSPNLAAYRSADPQYQIRGHWRLTVKTSNKEFILDRHTEQEALSPLYERVVLWSKS